MFSKDIFAIKIPKIINMRELNFITISIPVSNIIHLFLYRSEGIETLIKFKIF